MIYDIVFGSWARVGEMVIGSRDPNEEEARNTREHKNENEGGVSYRRSPEGHRSEYSKPECGDMEL